MLNETQVAYLMSLASFDRLESNGVTYAFVPRSSGVVQVNYPDFKAAMGLDDIRFHWMLGERNHLAGGSVLAWVTSETNTGDWDLFFEDKDSADGFARFIESYGFKMFNESRYALSCYNYDERVMVQLVGAGTGISYWDGMLSSNRKLFGSPLDVIEGFDISVCKWAVSSDYVFATVEAIRDTITRSIRVANNTPGIERRMIKYRVKGYYLPGEELIYDPNNNNRFPYVSSW
jgi:hypothetical protein